MNLTERTAAALAWIDAQIAICEAATIGRWNHECEEMPAGKVKHIEGYLIAECQMRPDAAFIATARTGYPAMLAGMKIAIKGLTKLAPCAHYCTDGNCPHDRKFREVSALEQILSTIENLK